MAPLKRPPQKKSHGKNKKQTDNPQNNRNKDTRSQNNFQKAKQANTKKGAQSSSGKAPTGKYPCLICEHQATFPNASKPPKIGKVNITWAQVEVIQEKYNYDFNYDLGDIHCSQYETWFSTIVGT